MNNNVSTIFPLDIPTVLKVGLEKWQKDFFWPVRSPGLYNEILRDLDQGYRAIIAIQKPGVIRENLVLRYKLLMEYVNLLYTQKLIQEIRVRGLQPANNGGDDYYYFLLHDIFPQDGFHTKRHVLKKDFSLHERVQEGKTALKATLKQCFVGRSVRRSVADGKVNAVFQPNEFTLEYIRTHVKGRLLFLGHSDIIPRDSISIREERGAAFVVSDEVSTRIAEMVLAVAVRYKVNFSERTIQYVHDLTRKKCRESLQDILIVSFGLRRFKNPLRLFMATSGMYERRVLATAVNLREDGSEVIGFAHGDYTGHDWSSHYVAINFGPVHSFGVFQKASVPLIEDTMKQYPEYVKSGARVFNINTEFFRNIWNRHKTVIAPQIIQKVMLIGVAYSEHATWITKNLPSQLVSLEFELRMIQLLRTMGLTVLYKAHPASCDQIDFFSTYAKVIHEPFEQVMDVADAYLFYRPMTTTFYEAFCTNKPIIFLHHADIERDWGKDFSLIEKRCRVVPLRYDARNRFVFDETQLRSALELKPQEINREFVEKYLFPSP